MSRAGGGEELPGGAPASRATCIAASACRLLAGRSGAMPITSPRSRTGGRTITGIAPGAVTAGAGDKQAEARVTVGPAQAALLEGDLPAMLAGLRIGHREQPIRRAWPDFLGQQ